MPIEPVNHAESESAISQRSASEDCAAREVAGAADVRQPSPCHSTLAGSAQLTRLRSSGPARS